MTHVPIAITICQDITVLTKSDSIIKYLIFCNISSSTRFGLPFSFGNERKLLSFDLFSHVSIVVPLVENLLLLSIIALVT